MTATPPTQVDKIAWKLHALQRYWFYSEKIKLLFFNEMQTANLGKLIPSEQAGLLIADHVIYMSYWLGGLYVVIEGYKKLLISDQKVDHLLLDSPVESLRCFRNGAFHYQDDYFSPKILNFLAGQGSTTWARTLHDRLGTVLAAQIAAAMAAQAKA